MKKCVSCNIDKPVSDFATSKKKDTVYLRHKCKTCKNRHSYETKKANGQYEKKKAKQREKRHDPNMRASFVLSDSRTFDRIKGMTNDLTIESVQALIDGGCFYCGIEHDNFEGVKIGVDRISNETGHTKNNVNACCTRCNFVRRDLPYEAWLIIVPALKEAIRQGLLTGWQYGVKQRRDNSED